MKRCFTKRKLSTLAGVLSTALMSATAQADSDGMIASLTSFDINETSFMKSLGLTLGGWLSFGGTYNAQNPDNNFNSPITFNDRQREFQLNQTYLILESAVNSGGNSWDFGGQIDLLFGTDARFTLNDDLDDDLLGNSFSRFYRLSFPQAYATIYAPVLNGITAKIGHFYTIIGNEVVTAPDNFFYSHAYTMQYGEPFEHTGVLFDTPLTDSVTLMAGAVNGWDSFFGGNEDIWNFLGGVSWSGDKTGVTLTAINGAVDGTRPNDDRFLYSLVVTHDILDNLHYTFQHDHAVEELSGPGEIEWYGINQYLVYDINDELSAGMRAEWFRDDDGASDAAGNITVGRVAGVPGSFYAVTLGLNWAPNSWVKIRPEVRYDWFDGKTNAAGTNDVFDAGRDENQLTIATDVILTF